MGDPGFQVYVAGVSGGSVEDWRRALNAPDSELPALSEEQKEIARRMDIPVKEYARGVLTSQYAEARNVERGKLLGERVKKVLEVLGPPDYRLDAIIREGVKTRWVARVETPRGVVNIAIPFEVADDVLDSGTVEDWERLKRVLLEALSRTELLRGEQ